MNTKHIRLGFLFPGQGAQVTGMGEDFYHTFESAREVFRKAQEAGGVDVAAICFREDERLHMTEYTQIALLATELAICNAVCEMGISPYVTAGLSLGEYGALAASGGIAQSDALAVIRKRGQLMQEAFPVGGAMTAVIGLEEHLVETVCRELQGDVWVANYNCPGQVVITGREEAVAQAELRLKESGARICKRLKVSGPFHSPLLQPAAEGLAKILEPVALSDIAVPYITNVTAEYVRDQERVKPLLAKQVASSVLWRQSMERMVSDGVRTFVELGPGRTLAGFAGRIDKQIRVISIEKVDDLRKLEALEAEEETGKSEAL